MRKTFTVMNDTFNGCSHTDVWASPKNWETTTSKTALKKDWYVQCNFYDPKFAVEYGKDGFQFRRRFNKYKTLELRQAAIKTAMQNMAELLRQGYNPITGQYMAPPIGIHGINRNPVYDENTPVKNALDLALGLVAGTKEWLAEMKRVKSNFKRALKKMGKHTIPIGSVKTIDVRLAMEYLHKNIHPLTDKRYNTYLARLSKLFSLLKDNGLTEINPVEKVERKKTIVEIRKTLTIEERIIIDAHLKQNYYPFWVFTNVFYHSGGREEELMNLKFEHVDLERLIYKSLIKKRKNYTWVERPIKKISVEYWQIALKNASPGDYIFSAGLIPGAKPMDARNISERWKRNVKKQLGINKDFYSLKHSNLDEISKHASTKEAARAAGHTNTRMVEKHYAVTLAEREMEAVRQMRNTFAPQPEIKPGGTCAPCSFTFPNPKSLRSAG